MINFVKTQLCHEGPLSFMCKYLSHLSVLQAYAHDTMQAISRQFYRREIVKNSPLDCSS